MQNPDRLPPGRVFSTHPSIPTVVVIDVLDLYIGDDDPDDGDVRFREIAWIVRMYQQFRIHIFYYVFLIMYYNTFMYYYTFMYNT